VEAAALAAHERLVRWVVRRQWRGGLGFEAAVHEGRIGLWQALRHFDPARGTRFSTYAVPAIQHAVWAAVAAAQAERAASPARPGLRPAATDAGAVAVERLHQAAVRAALWALVDQLPPRARQIVVGHWGLDGAPPRPFAALGQQLGVSRQRIHQEHTAALLALAHPSRSLPLRRLLGRDGRVAYQQTLARQRRWTRARRRRL
jgi:RNA polymerase sigma factor (sigma-70 family)